MEIAFSPRAWREWRRLPAAVKRQGNENKRLLANLDGLGLGKHSNIRHGTSMRVLGAATPDALAGKPIALLLAAPESSSGRRWPCLRRCPPERASPNGSRPRRVTGAARRPLIALSKMPAQVVDSPSNGSTGQASFRGGSSIAKGVSPGERPNPIPAPEGAAQPVEQAGPFSSRRVRRGLVGGLFPNPKFAAFTS
jgi:hypothetical protein